MSYSKAFNPEDSELLSRNATFRPGFLVGFSIDMPLSSPLVFETGFLYIQKGNIMTEEGKGPLRYQASRNYLVEFVEIPILLKYKLEKGGIALYPLAGISASYGTGGRIEGSIVTEDQNGRVINATSPGKIYFGEHEAGHFNTVYPGKPFDLGVQVGVDALLFEKVFLALRYSRSLNKFEYGNKVSGYNQSFQFQAGIPLRLVTRIQPKTPDDKIPSDRPGVRIYTGFSVGECASTFHGSEADFRLDDRPDSNFEKRRTVTYGFDFKIETSNYVFFRTGLFSVENGATQVKDGFTYPFHAETRYFSIPMLAGAQPLNLSNVRQFNLSVEGGVAANWELESHKEELTTDLHPDIEIKMKKFLLSAQVGLTCEVRMSDAVMLSASYRYFQDLDPFFKRTIGTEDYKLFNKGSFLKGGFMFRVN